MTGTTRHNLVTRPRLLRELREGHRQARAMVESAAGWVEYFHGDLASKTDAEGKALTGAARGRIADLASELLRLAEDGRCVLGQRRVGEGVTRYLVRRG